MNSENSKKKNYKSVFFHEGKNKKNFVMFNNEILLKDSNASLEAKGLYASMMSIKGIVNWDFSVSGWAKLLKCDTNTISRYINELRELGYIIRFRTPNLQSIYHIFDSHNKFIEFIEDPSTDILKIDTKNINISKIKDPEIKKSYEKIAEIQNSNKRNSQKKDSCRNLSYRNLSAQYSIQEDNINKSSINKNNIQLREDTPNQYSGNTVSESEINLKNINKSIESKEINHESIDSPNELTFSIEKKEHNLTSETKENEGLIKLNSFLTEEKENLDLSTNYNAATKAITNESETSNNKSGNKKMNKNELAKMQRKEEISKAIEIEIENENLREVLIDYFDFYIDAGKPIQIQNYRAMMRKLESLSNGQVENKIAIVEQSLQKSWLDFYELKNDYKKRTENKTEIMPAKSEIPEGEEDPYSLVLDENGNPVSYY